MTGYGRGESSKAGIHVTVEAKSVNSRFLEVNARLPRSLSQREKDVKDIVRPLVNRGAVGISFKVEREDDGAPNMRVNKEAAKSYYKLLNELRKTVKLAEKVRLEHLLHFSEVLEAGEEDATDEKEWSAASDALRKALSDLNTMRAREGAELAKDLKQRVENLDKTLAVIEQQSAERIPEERKRLQERIAQLVSDPKIVDNNRLELEIAILSEKLDVTEECVRFRSHNKMFLAALADGEAAGRKLNFLIQEMNREANTIGSKVNDAPIAQLVVGMKEELEKVREQLQNIE